jgi:PEGA domain
MRRNCCRWPLVCAIVLLSLALGAGGGCVRRTLTVTTDPPGALIYLNGVEAGRSPMERDFVFYGTYDVAVRKDGYETLKTKGKVIAPWWQWVPFDFFAEFLPLHDRQTLTYTLQPVSAGAVDPHKMLARAEQFGTKLESSEFTHPPSTHPAAATTRSVRATTRPLPSNPTTQPAVR